MNRAVLLALALCVPAAPASAIELLSGFDALTIFGDGVLASNDDASSNEIDITSVFPDGIVLNGTAFTSMWVNNNGNVSFLRPVFGYTPVPLPVEAPSIYVYQADHDSRSRAGLDDPTVDNLVYWHIGDEEIVVTWYKMGFYQQRNDLQNSYQLILRPRGSGVSVELRYDRCAWATGDASGGTDGFGGTQAQIGINPGGLEGFWLYEKSFTDDVVDICDETNAGVPGLWRFALSVQGVVQDDSPPNCGDGELNAEEGEECDDMNLDGGDGCSERCILEVDEDDDGAWDGEDNCLGVPNSLQADQDFDGFGDACDTCPFEADETNADEDGDGLGDVCDPCLGDALNDADDDGVCFLGDNCPDDANTEQDDLDDDDIGDACDDDDDGDDVPDVCDNCPRVVNPDQENADGDADTEGDACDEDIDNDGVLNDDDCAPLDDERWATIITYADVDGDGWGDEATAAAPCVGSETDGRVVTIGDNCPADANTNQLDRDGDGVGDVCDDDIDGDGVRDDGDGSGTAGDAPCVVDGIADGCDDNCPYVPNIAQTNTDGAGAGDACDGDQDGDGRTGSDDSCPTSVAENSELDGDRDGLGDACDDDDDGDGVIDPADLCPDERGDDRNGCVTPDVEGPPEECADAGHDAGSDAGPDAGPDAGMDAGPDSGMDAGADIGADIGMDADADTAADVIDPDTTEPDTADPDAADVEPDALEPDAIAPDSVDPDAVEPDSVAPDTTEPDVGGPDVETDTSAPDDVSEGDTAAPDAGETPLPLPAVSDSGCAAAPGAAGAWWGFALLGAVARRRRRG